MISLTDINFLFQILALGFKKYPKLYFILLLSLASIFIEMVAMSLVTSISNDKYLLFPSYLSTIDKNFLFSIILGLFTLRFISMFLIERYQVLIVRKYQAFLSSESLFKTLHFPLADIEKKEIGFFIAMGGDEASRASELLNSGLKIFNTSVLFIVYLIMIFYVDSRISFILAILFMVVLLMSRIILKKSRDFGAMSAQKSREAGSLFIDALNGVKTVKSFAIESFIYKQYKNSIEVYQFINYKIYLLSLISSLSPLIMLIVLFNIYVLIDFFGEKVLTSTYLISIFFILMRFLLNFGELLHTINKVVGNIKATSNIINFISAPMLQEGGENRIAKIENITLDSVDFFFSEVKEIFSNLNLHFSSQKSYAIIGKTGSGKSTLIDLIMHFISPTQGSILINGIDSTKIDIRSLKERAIYISQESIIFNETIRNNLIMDREYSDDKIMKVLKLVELDTLVEEKEEGLDYILNYKGTNISGGQKQRLNIARALLRDLDVLILDESINALDSHTRIKIVQRLLKCYKEKMIIFVTHDQDILNLVDEIIDLDRINKE